MKNIISRVFALLVLAICSQHSFAKPQIDNISGAWLGTMNIPEGPSLRIGIEVFKKADGKWGGNIASLDQGARYMLVSNVKVENATFTLEMAGAPVSVVGKINNSFNVINAKFNQGDSAFDLELNKVPELPEILRAQTPKDSVSYIEQEVSYKNSHDNTWLSGTITIPNDSKQHPAVMLVAGSGPNHRDSYHAGHRTFKVLADHLTKQGYVVLRSDKRGVFKSGGDFEDATLNDLVLDTQAAVQYLKSHKQVDSKNIILIGHSEGSLVSVMTAEHENVQGLVSLAGPGMSVLDILLLQDQTEPAAKGATKTETDMLLNFSQRFYHIVLSTPSAKLRKQKVVKLYETLAGDEAEVVAKWVNKNNGTLSIASAESDAFYQFLQQNPLPYWNKYKGKALILNGDKDSQVPAKENVIGIVDAITSQQATIESEVFEGLNHLFQPAKTGSVDEYKEIEKTIDEQVLSRISTWLTVNFN
ncbi:alpha/beta hydrolase family protein [Colwelliaceae bacterium 6471]